MSESGGIPRMNPADLAAIAEACQRGLVPGLPSIDAPPTVATGADATLFRKIMREEIDRNKRDIAAPDAVTIKDIVRSELEAIFADLDMPIDRENIHDTRRKFAKIFDWLDAGNALKAGFGSALIKALGIWCVGIFTAILGYVGYKGGH